MGVIQNVVKLIGPFSACTIALIACLGVIRHLADYSARINTLVASHHCRAIHVMTLQFVQTLVLLDELR